MNSSEELDMFPALVSDFPLENLNLADMANLAGFSDGTNTENVDASRLIFIKMCEWCFQVWETWLSQCGAVPAFAQADWFRLVGDEQGGDSSKESPSNSQKENLLSRMRSEL